MCVCLCVCMALLVGGLVCGGYIYTTCRFGESICRKKYKRKIMQIIKWRSLQK